MYCVIPLQALVLSVVADAAFLTLWSRADYAGSSGCTGRWAHSRDGRGVDRSPARPRDVPSSVPGQAASGPDRRYRSGYRKHRQGGRLTSRALSPAGPDVERDSRPWTTRRACGARRDRPGYEPFPQRGPFDQLDWAVPAQRRERRQASIYQDAQRSSLAEDGTDPVRPGSSAHQRKLLPVALLAPPLAAWRKESYRRGGSLSTNHHLSHAKERNLYEDLGAGSWDEKATGNDGAAAMGSYTFRLELRDHILSPAR